MLPRTFIILLCLSLLSEAATRGDRSSSVRGAEKRSAAKAVGSLPGQKWRAAAKKPPGRVQGQGSQFRRPSRWPARRLPTRRPQRGPATQFPQIPDNAQDINSNQVEPRQTPAYVICYLYPAESPMYQDIGSREPYVPTSNGAMYPPYLSYKTSLPATVRKRESGVMENKIFRQQLGSPYPLKLVCPAYEPVSANPAVPALPFTESGDNGPDYWLDTVDPDTAFGYEVPGITSVPEDGEIPLPYNSVYGSPGRVPASTYPSVVYGTPQAFRYPPQFPIRPNL